MEVGGVTFAHFVFQLHCSVQLVMAKVVEVFSQSNQKGRLDVLGGMQWVATRRMDNGVR